MAEIENKSFLNMQNYDGNTERFLQAIIEEIKKRANERGLRKIQAILWHEK